MMSHALARQVVIEAAAFKGYPMTLAALQLSQAVGWQESGYGSGWKRPPIDPPPHNWGAVQCGPPPCPPTCFGYGDTHADGQPYAACFRRYSDDVAGAAGMLGELHRRPKVWAAMQVGDAHEMARAMRLEQPLYFERKDWKGYGEGLANRAKVIAESLHEPLAVTQGRRWAGWLIGGLVATGLAAVVWWEA